MPERVRLVIWDLDDTFWRGTVSEGGMTYVPDHHELVIELARRGIVSSICSKNDMATVRALLAERGILEYFVLPSINWEPKGPRLAAMIETFGLRPETVMFIDDNPINLREAAHHVPCLQVADETIIPTIRGHELFRGKDDSSLSRLQQYKALERRATEAEQAGGNNIEFLRASGITVAIEVDVAAHLDRAIELINRTNQLNFTKRRQPEDIEAARAALTAELGHTRVQAGLIRVADKYGDHGYVGFYLMDRLPNGWRRLLDFCFSCRIMGLHVEQFVYGLLERPVLQVTGEVASDIFDQSRKIDWITLAAPGGAGSDAGSRKLPPVLARGGCNLAAVTHYFSLYAEHIEAEWNFLRAGIAIRLDHSLLLRMAIEGLPPGGLEVAGRLGYVAQDFQTRAFGAGTKPDAMHLLSCWADSEASLYRHKQTGLVLPFWLIGSFRRDLTTWRDPAFEERLRQPEQRVALAFLRAEFEYVGLQDETQTRANLAVIFDSVPAHERVFVVMPNERNHAGIVRATEARLRSWITKAAAGRANVRLLDTADFVRSPAERRDADHFDRMVYYRMFEAIRDDMIGDARAFAGGSSLSLAEAS